MLIQNRSARHHYTLLKQYIAGIVLQGTEIKSIRRGKVNFQDAYCYEDKAELFIKNLSIAPYELGTYANHTPARTRKLLLKKADIIKISQAVKEKGVTIVPLKLFINAKGLAKIEIALAKGKKLYDKRASIKEREIKRNLRQRFAGH